MKSLKAVALVAGALAAAGAATPAVAQGGAAQDPGLGGVVRGVTGGPVKVQPLQQVHDLGKGGKGTVPSTLQGVGQTARQQHLIGGL